VVWRIKGEGGTQEGGRARERVPEWLSEEIGSPQETGHHPEAQRTPTLPAGDTGRVGRRPI
jgi:hypothetical protein